MHDPNQPNPSPEPDRVTPDIEPVATTDVTRDLARGPGTAHALSSRAVEELALDLIQTREALAALLEQQTRDATANRAQARELIKAFEQLQASQEYVGKALREDRRMGRWMTALAVVGPIAAAALVWALWGRMDDVRQELHADLRADRQPRTAQIETPAAKPAVDPGPVRDDRVDGLSADIEALRRELAGAQGALGDERRRGEEREVELAERLARAELHIGQLPGLRAQLESVRERAAADASRADELASELERRGTSADSVVLTSSGDRAAAAAAGESEIGAEGPDPRRDAGSELVNGAPADVAAAIDANVEAAAAQAERDPEPGAVRDAAQLSEIRSALNSLVEDATGAVRYSVGDLGGVSGKALLDVVVHGHDERGRLVRSLEAPRAEILVLADQSRVRMQFFDGHLVVGKRRAPFFMGSYELVLDVEPARWRASGLNCIRLE